MALDPRLTERAATVAGDTTDWGRPAAAHGGCLAAARRRFPAAPEPFLDLSTGINPHPYPLPPLPAEAFARLPEPEQVAALEQAAASAYGAADPANVVAAPGTQALIQLLPLLWPARRAAVLGPCYAEHARVWRGIGSDVVEARSLSDLRGAAVAVVCNPNNPDGRRHSAAALRDLAQTCGLLVVDEAFADLEEDGLSLAPVPPPGVVVLRSFGKTYGLAGLRLGFALAAPDRAAALRGALGSWAVSGPAIAVGRVALADAGWLAAARADTARDAARLDALLRAAGLEVIGGTSLFRLAASDRAGVLFGGLGAAGILVRRFPEHPRWLRFGLPGAEQGWRRLAAALDARGCAGVTRVRSR